jgi:hypothetical protein
MTGTGSAGEARAYRILAAPAVGSEVLLDTRSYKSVFVPASVDIRSALHVGHTLGDPLLALPRGVGSRSAQSCADATGKDQLVSLVSRPWATR